MKLEDQVLSLELAKKLKELGVKQESLFYWARYWNDKGEVYLVVREDILENHEDPEISKFSYPAYTVSELGTMLEKNGIWYIPVTFKGNWTGPDVKNNTFLKLGKLSETTEADARAKMLVYLLENNLVTL